MIIVICCTPERLQTAYNAQTLTGWIVGYLTSDLNALCHFGGPFRREAISFIVSCSIPFKRLCAIVRAASLV